MVVTAQRSYIEAVTESNFFTVVPQPWNFCLDLAYLGLGNFLSGWPLFYLIPPLSVAILRLEKQTWAFSYVCLSLLELM